MRTAEIVFVVPSDGREIVAPAVDWLREMVLTAGEEFWCGGCGEAWLKHPGGAELLLGFAKGHGFFLQFIDAEHVSWIPYSEKLPETKVVRWVGGNPMIVSERFFSSRDLAWTAI